MKVVGCQVNGTTSELGGFQRSLQHRRAGGCNDGQRKPGPEPQWAKRERFAVLIGEGHTIADAARGVGIHYRTGRRWLRGRTLIRPSGMTSHYEPVVTVKQPISARFVSPKTSVW